MKKLRYLCSLLFITALHVITAALCFAESASAQEENLLFDVSGPTSPFPHKWEYMFGSGRAILSLRESYRNDLKQVKTVADVKYIRFHNIFHDEVGVYDEDKDGKPIYNFAYVDKIYDGLLANGVRPFIELSFMPKKLASSQTTHSFWYQPNVNPPKDWDKWGELVYQFTNHLVQRYGIDEVSKWYFEVWNEPDIEFWTGEPKEETYYKLYDVTAKAVKKADSKLKVGGPATAMSKWTSHFIDHCVSNHIPLDFYSTHAYANEADAADNQKPTGRAETVAGAMRSIREQVKASKMPDLPIFWSEYNASYNNEVEVTDSEFMGPWIANNIRLCNDLADGMSFWTFSDVFEEDGVVKRPFYGGFGLIAAGGIPKNSFNAFKLLHLLGDQRIDTAAPYALITKRSDGAIVLAVWNYYTAGKAGPAKKINIEFQGGKDFRRARIQMLDREHGTSLTAWEAMGKPDFPLPDQQDKLIEAASLPPAVV